jgi:DNA-binding GntR family transcriptional regulator
MPKQRTPTRAQRLADALRNDILSARFRSGERLIELNIAHEHNVSQNAVRDALGILEREGYITRRPRQGVIITPVNANTVFEILDLADAIGGMAVKWITSNINAQQLATLEAIVVQMRQSQSESDQIGFFQSVFQFHFAIIQNAQRPLTTQVTTLLQSHAHLVALNVRMRVPSLSTHFEAWGTMHEGLIENIKQQNVSAVVKGYEAFIDNVRQRLREAYRTD